jgi:hypothetical protein
MCGDINTSQGKVFNLVYMQHPIFKMIDVMDIFFQQDLNGFVS